LKKTLLFCFALLLLGFLDWLTTIAGVFCFGAVEVNPLFSGLAHSNVLAFSGIKLLVTVFVGLLFYKTDKIKDNIGSNFNLGKHILNTGYFASFMILTVAVANNALSRNWHKIVIILILGFRGNSWLFSIAVPLCSSICSQTCSESITLKTHSIY
jgi:hypothetical protein